MNALSGRVSRDGILCIEWMKKSPQDEPCGRKKTDSTLMESVGEPALAGVRAALEAGNEKARSPAGYEMQWGTVNDITTLDTPFIGTP